MDSIWLVFCSGDLTPACFSTYQKAKTYVTLQVAQGRELMYFGCKPLDTEVVQ